LRRPRSVLRMAVEPRNTSSRKATLGLREHARGLHLDDALAEPAQVDRAEELARAR
jgi:hypothetical protein